MRKAPLTLLLILASSPALADRIDGGWCSPDGLNRLHIDGPVVVTPGGNEITGTYSRHAFAYTVPEGEADAGQRIEMQQLNEGAAEVYLPSGTETWRRCQLTS